MSVTKKVEFTPAFLPQYQRRQIRGIADAEKRGYISRKNTSAFYTQLYATLIEGIVQKESAMNEYTELPNGDKRSFDPDIVKHTPYGTEETEVKASSINFGGYYIPNNQAENYLYRLVQRVNDNQSFPSMNYSFFKYGHYGNMKLYMLPNWKLQSVLSSEVRSTLVLPINAVLYLTQMSGMNRITFDRTNCFSESGAFNWRFPGKYFSAAHKEELFPKSDFGDLEKLLFVDKLEVTKEYSPDNLVSIGSEGGKYKVPSFPITRYAIKESAKADWIKHLKENHALIAKTIGIRDLYSEVKEFERKKEDEKKLLESSFPWEMTLNLDLQNGKSNGHSNGYSNGNGHSEVPLMGEDEFDEIFARR